MDVERSPAINPNNLYRNSLATYFLPSVDEWYKAAYYDPTSGAYFDYPTGSNAAPTPVASGTAAGTAVYTRPFGDGPADITLAGGLSPYGTMGQGGNVLEWEETDFDLVNGPSSRCSRDPRRLLERLSGSQLAVVEPAYRGSDRSAKPPWFSRRNQQHP